MERAADSSMPQRRVSSANKPARPPTTTAARRTLGTG